MENAEEGTDVEIEDEKITKGEVEDRFRRQGGR